ncbi:D-mannonate oxidoreductase [Raoultella terrigena]|uniref:D-mannonate oxidoreductase n=1 Tax=Raoultella terrigena TaxID=577 RepID=A0A4U9D031_RAOTE|nr:D-mannonate oxidoreductase [Raoultella terrigena]
MQDEVLRAAARRLMLDEQAPTLSIEGVDLTGYADGLLERFSNPALKHRTWARSRWTQPEAPAAHA